MEKLIAAEHLSFHYTDEEGKPASPEILKDLTLTLEAGSFVAVLGHNGCGKSTLAKHMNAILLPTGGKMWIAGIDTCDEEKLYEIRQHVGMVFQNPDNQIVATVVEEDAAFGPENMGVEPKEIRSRVYQALKMVGMYDYHLHAPHLLSGGQKQRVAIAGVLAMKPKCIVLDEPTAMLDPQGRADIMRILHELHEKQHITIILITHHMDEAVQAQRVAVLDGGHLVMDGTPREIFTQTKRLRALGLEAPQSIELLERINQTAGEQIPMDALTVTECADRLEAWLKGGAQK